MRYEIGKIAPVFILNPKILSLHACLISLSPGLEFQDIFILLGFGGSGFPTMDVFLCTLLLATFVQNYQNTVENGFP